MAAEIKKIDEKQIGGWLTEEYNPGLIHQAVVTYQANRRAGTAATKNRSQVAGKNKKPWRQKGTGRSRHGSEISPIWVGGGRAHGPRSADYSKKITSKMKRKALLSALSRRFEEGALYLLDAPQLEKPSTSELHKIFIDNGLNSEKILLLLDSEEKNLRLSVRNLPYCKPFDSGSLNVFQVVANPVIVFTEAGLENARECFENGIQ
ncbi:MAG: 50S ribosomal protein L4 [bacterium]